MTNKELGELEMQKVRKEREVSAAFLQYIAGTAAFQQWEDNRVVFENTHVWNHWCSLNLFYWCIKQGDDLILVWQQLKGIPEVAELAEFAILLLGVIVNQAGNERDFSDLKIKKTWLQNHLGIPKLQKMSKASEPSHVCCHYSQIVWRSEPISDRNIK